MKRHVRRLMLRNIIVLLSVAVLGAACSSSSSTADAASAATPNPSATMPAEADDDRDVDDDDNDEAAQEPSQDSGPAPEPVPYQPAGRPGSADAYNELVAELEEVVPAGLRADMPWPDLRNPDPAVAQIEIFELWIWMDANLTEPRLTEVMTADGSPSREEVVGIFGRAQAASEFRTRLEPGYEAFDHRVITFESAGLPLWLTRDTPDDAVVVYYRDRSAPTVVTDQETGDVVDQFEAVPAREWLSIMVPTDFGWQLWRDQLLEAAEPPLEYPDVPPPPGGGEVERRPDV